MQPSELASIPLWIVAFPQGTLRKHVGGRRVYLKLPEVPALQALLRAAGVRGDDSEAAEASLMRGPYVVGLARVSPGSSCDFDFQEDVLHSYFRDAGYSVIAKDFAAVDVDPPISAGVVRHDQNGPATIWGTPKLSVYFTWPRLVTCSFGLARSESRCQNLVTRVGP